jgi:hypothetical protein
LHVEAEQRLGRRTCRPLERPRDRSRWFHRKLFAVPTREARDVCTRAVAIAAGGVDLDDELVEPVVERLASERTLGQGERAVRFAVREERRRPAEGVRGGRRHACPLDLKPCVE